MGTASSSGSASRVPDDPLTGYLCISMAKPSTVCYVHGDEGQREMVTAAILETWASGIAKEHNPKSFRFAHSWVLRESPFGLDMKGHYCPRTEIGILSRILLKLHNSGWRLLGGTELTRQMHFTQWFFDRQEGSKGLTHSSPQVSADSTPLDGAAHPAGGPSQALATLPCISLSSVDVIQLVNVPVQHYPRIRELIATYWDKGIQHEQLEQNSLQIYLQGKPWHGKVLSMPARLLVLQLFQILYRKYDLEFHCRVNLRSKADSFFFRPRVEQPIPKEQCAFMGVCLYGKNGLLLIDSPQDMIPVVRAVVTETWDWNGGIKDEKEYVSCYGFTLGGSPWWSSGSQETAMSRLIICRLIEALQECGWSIVTGAAFAKHSLNKDMLIFRKSPRASISVMCFCPTHLNKLRLVKATPEVTSNIRDILQSRWPGGVKKENAFQTPFPYVEFKLGGKPWSGKSSDVRALSMMCHVMKSLKDWRLVLSADISAKYMYPGEDDDDDDDDNYALDAHSLWFARQSGPHSISGKPSENSSIVQ